MKSRIGTSPSNTRWTPYQRNPSSQRLNPLFPCHAKDNETTRQEINRIFKGRYSFFRDSGFMLTVGVRTAERIRGYRCTRFCSIFPPTSPGTAPAEGIDESPHGVFGLRQDRLQALVQILLLHRTSDTGWFLDLVQQHPQLD